MKNAARLAELEAKETELQEEVKEMNDDHS